MSTDEETLVRIGMGDRQFFEAGFLPFENQNKQRSEDQPFWFSIEFNTIANVCCSVCKDEGGKFQRVLPSFTKRNKRRASL